MTEYTNWDDNIKIQPEYGQHKFNLQMNSYGIYVVKCSKCQLARLYLLGQDQTKCRGKA